MVTWYKIVPNQKYLGLILDETLTFNGHVTSKFTAINELTSTLRKLYHYIPRDSLITIYKSFIRPHLDYADVIIDKPAKQLFLMELNQLKTIPL